MKSIYPFKLSIIISLLFIISNLINAQVIYTDLTPDHAIINENLDLDLNEYGINDVLFNYLYQANNMGESYETRMYLKNNTGLVGYPQIFASDSIGENLDWSYTSPAELQFIIHQYGGDPYYQGPWDTIRDGFIAVKLKVDNQHYYGWIRLHIIDNNHYNLAVAGFAINTESNQPILAGEAMPVGATSVYGSDEQNHLDGRGIRASFTTDFERSQFSEYRVFVAKSEDENANNLEYMSQLPEEYYLSIPIDEGTFFEVFRNLYENSISIDGEIIKGLTDYRIHILNINNSGDPTLNILSTPSDIFHLKEPLYATEIEMVMDIDNTASAKDICVIFNEEQNTPPIEEYRAFIVKTENSSEFNTETALQLTEECYTSILAGYHYNIDTLNPEQLDASEEYIIENQSYNIFILSVADSIASQTSILSDPSREIILKPNSFFAGQKEGEHINWFQCDDEFSNAMYWGSEYPAGEDNCHVDMNRDGITDFYLYGEYTPDWTGSVCHYYIEGERNNKVLICDHEQHNNWIDLIKKNEGFGEGYNFSNQRAILLNFKTNGVNDPGYAYYHGHMLGDLYNQDTTYIGFELNDNEEVQYAWLRLVGNKFYDYAYQDISAGNTSDSCITDGVQFSTQAELEQFTINYPNCKHIEGDVIFEGDDITNLNAFNNIISIDGNLIINNCPLLDDINGQQNLDLNSLNSIEITNNPNLAECDIKNICQYLSDNGNILIENNKEGCQDNAEVKSICTSSLAELKTHNWQINPNPANGFINITAISNFNIKSTLKIVNSFGSVVEVLEMNNSESIINIENYPAGLYYIQIYNSDGFQEIHKVIVN